MPNIGEEICGEYLKNILNCEFVSYNITNQDIQGEIDVFGINIQSRTIFICEAATHTKGLQYVTDKNPDDYNRFYQKFKKDIDYGMRYFADYNIKVMLWSPIVAISRESAKYNTFKELQELKKDIESQYGLELELIINSKYQQCLNELKDFALSHTAMFTSGLMRTFQIEKNLEKRGLS